MEGFKVAGKFPKSVGLTDGSPLTIHVLTLGTEEHATKLKLMQIGSKKPARLIKQPHIHTIAGLSYLTIFVKDVDLVLKRAKQLGYKPYAKSPQILPEGLPQDVCLLMLKDRLGDLSGKRAIIVGRSNIVGKPMAALLLAESCTVTIAHSRTQDLARVVSGADIVVGAVGRPEFIRGAWVKPGAVVVDAGYHPGGVGDVELDAVTDTCSYYTPVPGGVGPMTINTLIAQTVEAAERHYELDGGV